MPVPAASLHAPQKGPESVVMYIRPSIVWRLKRLDPPSSFVVFCNNKLFSSIHFKSHHQPWQRMVIYYQGKVRLTHVP